MVLRFCICTLGSFLRKQLGRYRTIREVIGRYRKIEEDNGTLFESKVLQAQVRYSRPDQLERYRKLRKVIGSYGKIQEVLSVRK